MSRHLFNALLLVLAVAAGLSTGLPSPYFVISPGGSYDIGPRLSIPDDRREEAGRLAFTAVYQQPASWADAISTYLLKNGELVPADEVIPPGSSQQEVNNANQRLIDESKPVAAVVGLRAAGFDVRIRGDGAEVSGTVAGMPAEGILQPGDLIIGVDGQPIQTAADLVEAIRRHTVGEQVDLSVLRDGQKQDVTVGTRGAGTEPSRPQVGIFVSTRGFAVDLPFPVEINTEGVGGPSAGFMFALGVYDAVTAGDLTRGNFVAGTGTIAVDGTVGPIGGAAEKVMAAERDGAQVFLVPRENYADAASRARRARVVPVDRFEDGVRALCGLPARGDEAGAPVPPACTRAMGAPS